MGVHNEANKRLRESISDKNQSGQESDSEKARQILSSERQFEEVNLKRLLLCGNLAWEN